MFPNVVIESEEGVSINTKVLEQELNLKLIDDSKERYQLTWPGKNNAKILANSPINKTLRPNKNKSVDFDYTKNVYIEGDNLEVLKILQESYLNKIKMIYIDPPYNTGNNLIYKNDYYKTNNKEKIDSGIIDNDGNKLVSNNKLSGRFHSDWLCMMYSRLILARNILSDDGFIAIAIDDNELFNLYKLCEEIFNESNFVGLIVTRGNPQGRSKKNIDPVHEYHLIFAKNIDKLSDFKIKKDVNDNNTYTNFIRGGNNSSKYERPRRYYPMLVKDNRVFCINKEEYNKIYDEKKQIFNENFINEINNKYINLGYKVIWPINNSGEEKVWQRTFERAIKEHNTYIYNGKQIKTLDSDYRTPISLWDDNRYSNVHQGTNRLKNYFDNINIFDYSKSVFTVKDLVSLSKNDIVLDFFSGSATTAEAVMRLNSEDEGNRKYIMVQTIDNQELPDEAIKAGYKTIPEIAQERIRKAAKKIKEETSADIDYGFRVYEVDSSNMKDVYYQPNELSQEQLELFENNIKDDRTSDDLLWQVIIDLGLKLDVNFKKEKLKGNNVYFVNNNELVACFDYQMDNSIIEQICSVKPQRIILRDSSFENDSDRINFEQTVKRLSSETKIMVI